MSKTFDIYVMGKTGTGKSTLINTVLENDVAPIGKGEAVTRENICYTGKTALQNSNYVLNLWDTVGLEINEKITEETIEKLKKQIETDCSDGNGGLSVVWFCVNQRCKRLESYEIQLIRRISFAQEIPFVIVMTQCLSEDDTELEQSIREAMPDVTVCKVMAKPYMLRGGMVPSFGVKSLLSTSIVNNSELRCDMLKAKLDMLCKDYQESERLSKEKLKSLEDSINCCIDEYASSAERIGWIPGGCIPFVHGKCFEMIKQINRLAELPLPDSSTEFLSSFVIGLLSTPLMLIPILSAGVAKSYIATSGETYRNALLTVLQSSTEQELRDIEKTVERIKNEIKRAR